MPTADITGGATIAAATRQVALIIRQEPAVVTGMLRGVRAYFANDPRWVFFIRSLCDAAAFRWLKKNCQGVMVYYPDLSLHRKLRASGLPCVSLYDAPWPPMVPTVIPDDAAIGRVAADYFLQRGFRHFGLVNSAWHPAAGRGKGFVQTVSQAGLRVHTYTPRRTREPGELLTAMRRWLAPLPRPIAVLAANDSLGIQVLDACRSLNIEVPYDLAVIGVGDYAELCNMCMPPLASIAVSFEKVGYEAASLLHRLIDGQPAPRAPLLIAPQGVVARQSSETWAVDDPIVSRAAHYIVEHACDPIGVRQVAEHVGCPYPRLLARFQETLGRNLHDEIRRVQLDRAKRLLVETTMPVRDVAIASGWRDGKQIGRVFRQHVGVTPMTYRKQARLRP